MKPSEISEAENHRRKNMGIVEKMRLDGKKGATIATKIKGLNFKKKDNYTELMEQTIDDVVAMRKVFKPYLL